MNIFLQGAKSDIQIELPSIEKFFEEYKQLNNFFVSDIENRYESILTKYGTEDLKFTLGFLTSIYKNIENKGFKIINSVFDAVERYGEFELSVFYGNRILEKYSENKEEDILIRAETLRRILNALINIDDKLFFVYYLIKYTKEIEKLLSLYPLHIKEIYTHISDWYQFLYFYSLSITGDNEKAFGFLLKSYDIRRFMLENKLSDIIYGNTILYIANIIGLYSQLENSLISIVFFPDEYIEELLKEVKLLKEELEKNPSKYPLFLKGYFRKYYNELLTNIYVLGFHTEHREIVEIFPEIVNKDHLLMVKIDELFKNLGDKEESDIKEQVEKLKGEIDITFNNLTKSKQEQILYLYYNLLLEIEEDTKKLLKEIEEKKEKRFKKSLLFEVLKIKGYIKIGEIEKAKKVAEKTKERAIVENNRFIIEAVNRYLDEL